MLRIPAYTVVTTMMTTALVAVVLAAGVTVTTGEPALTVATPYGALRGSRKSLGPLSYVDRFFKIPYAKPPVGDLRFRTPQPPSAWNGTLDAMLTGPSCPQPPDNYVLPSQVFPQSEDCLYLNVYRPKVDDANARLPVMVWLHGGGFVTGDDTRFDWTPLAALGVVVVTVDYRLGPLGFLSTEDAVSPGNYGLHDQVRALHWVRDVISHFNGDAGNVTIFGESAGAASVSFLLLSREARGLFHRAIMESGASLSPWAMGYPESSPEPQTTTVDLATRLGCDVTDKSRLVACLRTKDAMDINNATFTMKNRFTPVSEATFGQSGFLTGSPVALLRQGDFSHVPILRGFNKDESSIGMQDPTPAGMTLAEVQGSVQYVIQRFYGHTPFPVNTHDVFQQAMKLYFIDPQITHDPDMMRQAFVQLNTDVQFVSPTLYELQLSRQRSTQPQFVYRFTYRSLNRLNEAWKGVQHTDELAYVTGAPVAGIQVFPHYVSQWNDMDRRVSNDVMTMWTNFAKYGDPTPTAADGAKWLPWTPAQPRVLDIGDSLRMVDNGTLTPQRRFWMQTMAQAFGGLGSSIIG